MVSAFAALVAAVTAAAAVVTAKPTPPPHLVVVLGDDFGTYDGSSYRNGAIHTPTVDGLVKEGLLLDTFYVFKICSPTRASLVTGRYPFHVSQSLPEGFHAISKEYKLLPEVLATAPLGYRSYHVGKWHNGFFNESYIPSQRGFAETFGFLCAIHDVNHWNEGGHWTTTKQCIGQDIFTEKGPAYGKNGTYSAELYGAAAVGFVEKHAAQYPTTPMYLQVEYFVPHAPTSPGPPTRYILPPFDGLEDRTRANYSGMVVSMDEALGNLTAALRAAAMWEDTLLVLFGDNGGAVPDGGRNWPLRGCKWTNWEGGVRQTAVWAGGRLPAPSIGRRSSAIAHVSDIFPTLAQLAGIGDDSQLALVATGPAPLDGMSLVSVLEDPTSPSPRTEVLFEGQRWEPDDVDNKDSDLGEGEVVTAVHGLQSAPSPPPAKEQPGALRVGDWKLIVGSNKYAYWYTAPEDNAEQATVAAKSLCKLVGSGGASFPPTNTSSTACEPYCLFNLHDDPCETKNLAAAQPAQVEALLARLRQLSARPVPYDSCLPGCTAELACKTRLDYRNFFGPYYPPFPTATPDLFALSADEL